MLTPLPQIPLRPLRFLQATLVVGVAFSPALAQSRSQVPPWEQNERETDAPLPGATRLPNLPPSPPIGQGPFVSYQVNVTATGANIPGDAANEPSIAVDPGNRRRIAIGWRQFDNVASNFRQAGWGYTSDGGQTWTFPGVLEPGVFRSDPVLESDASGTFFYNSLTTITGNYTCDYFRSTNGGTTFGNKVYGYGGDKAWIAIDRTGGVGNGHIYSAWDFAGCCGSSTFNRSIDGGQSFSSPTTVPNQPNWGTLAVGPDGELYVSGIDLNDYSRFYVAKSTNAKSSSGTPTFDFVRTVNLGGPLVYGGNPNPDGLLGQAWIAVDQSNGPQRGWVYLLCSVDPTGSDPCDVRFSRSTDGGLTWSSSIRINKDPLGSNRWQWFGALGCAPNGRLDVVWNDTSHSNQANLCELYYSFSVDGGSSWAPAVQVTPMWNSNIGWPNQNKIGDYYDMYSDMSAAHVAYSATFNGEQDVYYVRIGE